MRKSLVPVFALALAATGADAQNFAPRDNPTVSLGGKSVSVEYGRPSLGGRSVDELLAKLPEDRVWRAGSEQVTTFTTEGAVMVGDQKVPAGTYSLYLHIPAEGDVSLVLNSVVGRPLGSFYDAAPENLKDEPWPHMPYQSEIGDKEVARAAMTSVKGGEATDLFTITLGGQDTGGKLTAAWGDRAWSVAITPAE